MKIPFIKTGRILTGILLVIGIGLSQSVPRPDRWAQPVSSEILKNWYKIDDGVYRSRQPDRNGFEEIRKKGIKTILNLRTDFSDAGLIEGLGLNLVEIPMAPGDFAEDVVVTTLLAIQVLPQPVLIHCQHGADRTGAVAAVYRVVVQGWSKEEALAEMTGGGFGFHDRYVNIPAFIRSMNVDGIREVLKRKLKARINAMTEPPVSRHRIRIDTAFINA